MDNQSKLTNNVIMLYVMNIVQLILPLIVLPYLTRVLSVDNYGVVAYVKSIIVYSTLVIEFGFMLSATHDIVKVRNDRKEIGKIMGRTTQAKLFLSFIAFIILLIMISLIPILRRHVLFAIMSFGSPFLSIFLYDYFFRGIEQMQIITCRYLLMRGISTVLTFIFVKGDSELLLIPLFDIIGSLAAVLWIRHYFIKLGIHIEFDNIKNVIFTLKSSFIYFISDMSATVFGAFNTLLVGIFLSATDVAYWGILSTLIAAVQTMYSPICDGIYPHMIQTKSLKLLLKIILIFCPFLIIGGCVTFFGAKYIMLIIGGLKYISAVTYLRLCTPVLIITFFSNLLGWPTLGAIDKVSETTLTTIIAAIVQVVSLVLLIVIHQFSLTSVVIMRTLSELVMLLGRFTFTVKFRHLFNYN